LMLARAALGFEAGEGFRGFVFAAGVESFG
jgi:hypothetical protein